MRGVVWWALTSLKGYESGDHSRGRAHHEGAAENANENPHRLEKSRSIKLVRVGAGRLVRHDGPETQKHESKVTCDLPAGGARALPAAPTGGH